MSNQNKLASIINNNWEIVKSEARHVWGKLTDQDISEINNYNGLIKKLHDVYQFSEEEINTRIDTFIEDLNLQSNLTYIEELKEALYENATNMKDKIRQKIHINFL